MSTEERAPTLHDTATGKNRSVEAGRDHESLLRLAEAIADGQNVDWGLELEESAGGNDLFRGLRTLESIANYHLPDELDGTLTPVLLNGGEVKRDSEPRETWGSLVLREQLGRGACASVFRAHDPALDREVALKLPHEQDPVFARFFLREARRLARLHHENVVQVHGAEERDGRVGMWMELVEGHSLEECLSAQGPFSASEAALIGIDLCRALAAVHGAGLVHRDLKSVNVMREEGGRIVLMDFSSVVEDRKEAGIADDSSTHGTPCYTAPEVLEGDDATSASDLYSLGVLLYRLVSGRYPVEVDTLEELLEAHRDQGPMSLVDVRPDLPASFVQVIDRALESDPDARYATAGKMERALVGFTQIDVLPEKLVWPWVARQNGRLWAGLAAVVLIAVALGLGIRALLPGSLAVEANLFRKGEDLADERLSPGDQLALGDRLYMKVEGSRPMHLYVLNEDAAGSRYRLFPLEQLALENPLPEGVEHWLPGLVKTGDEVDEGDNGRYWKVTSVGGEETLMLIASTHAVEELEERIATIPAAGRESELEIGEFRGVGGLVAGKDAGPDLSLDELRRELEASHGEDLSIWQINLSNPPQPSAEDAVD